MPRSKKQTFSMTIFDKGEYTEQYKRDHYDIARVLIRRDAPWYPAFVESMKRTGESKSAWIQEAMRMRLEWEGRVK